MRATWRAEGAEPAAPVALTEIATGATWELDRDVAAWLVAHAEPLAAADLATLRLGPIRPKLEPVVAARGATLLVPLLDRGTLVGLVEGDHVRALREAERGLVAESARAAARALTYVSLSRIAAREGATAREVEVAEAMRLQASASRDDELGPWVVAADYRSAPRTTGAAWSASLLGDGRLAILVTEGRARGVVAAIATAALTGAFTAATMATATVTLDELLATLRASAEGVLRGGEPIAAFVAILAPLTGTIAWSCAGHPGALVITPGTAPGVVPLGGGGARLGDPRGDVVRGAATLGPDLVLVVASSGVRGGDAGAWYGVVRDHAAAGTRLAGVLVDAAASRGPSGEDLLAVVVRQRARRSPIG